MTVFLTNILLALAWAALTGEFTPANFVVGFGIGFVLLWQTRKQMAESDYFAKAPKVIGFILFFLWELIQANIRMALTVISPKLPIRPAVVAIPLDVTSDAAITLLANMITLTPGTLFLDVSQDKSVMYVHTIHIEDVEDFRQRIKNGLERRVMEVLS